MSRYDPVRPRAGVAFYKAHGLGNDYLVVEEGDAWTLDVGAVGRVCHPREGVGGDGVVVLLGSAGEPFPLRMFNPDGSEFERSGNGLRVLASWLHRTGRVAAGRPFEVEVGGDRITMTVHGREAGAYDVSVDMGRAEVGPEAVELDRSALEPSAVESPASGTEVGTEAGTGSGTEAGTEAGTRSGFAPPDDGDGGGVGPGRLALPPGAELDGPVPVHLVRVGNPHAVVFTDTLVGKDPPTPDRAGGRPTRDLLDRLGPALATHPAFAHGTNVQLARVAEPTGSRVTDTPGASEPTGSRVNDTSGASDTPGASDPPGASEPTGPRVTDTPGTSDTPGAHEPTGSRITDTPGTSDTPTPGGGTVDALVWERGVGHTTASGTSACAVAVAAVASGRLDPGTVEVRMEGGSLFVEVGPELDVVLRGPVEEVMTGEMTAGFVASLEGR